METAQIGGVIRTLLAFLGGIVVSKGWIDNTTMLEIVGVLVPLGVAAWSVLRRRQANKAEAEKIMVAIAGPASATVASVEAKHEELKANETPIKVV